MKNENNTHKRKILSLWVAGIIFFVAFGMSIDRFINISQQFPDIVFGLLFGVGGYLVSQAMSLSKADHIKGEAKDYIREKRVCNDSIRQECSLDAAIALTERNLNAVMNRFREYYDSKAINQNFHNDLPMLSILFDDIDRCSSDVDSIRKLMESFLENDLDSTIIKNNKKDCRPDDIEVINKEMLKRLGLILRDVKEAYNRRTETLDILLTAEYKEEYNKHSALFNVMSSDLAKALQTLNEICSLSLRNDDTQKDIQLTIDYLEASRKHSETIAGIPKGKADDIDNGKIGDGKTNEIVVFQVMQDDIYKAIEDLNIVNEAPLTPKTES